MASELIPTTEAETTALSLIDAPKGVLPAPLEQLREVAELLAASGPMVPQHFQGKPDLCLAVAYQAARWRMDPVAVANKAYIANNRISYEAQLIAALVYSSPRLLGTLQISYEGKGAQRYCHVVGYLRAEPGAAKSYTSPTIGQIKVKNSPLWWADPDQQLAYFSVRAWARRWMPDEIMGLYAPDEFVPEPVHLQPGDPDAFDEDMPTPEPSGGEGWKEYAEANAPRSRDERQGVRDQGARDQGQKAPKGKPKSAPTPSGGGESAPNPEAEAAWQTCVERCKRIMEFEIAPPARAAWEILVKDPAWRKLKAYDQTRANNLKNMVFDHIKKISEGTPTEQAPPDPEAGGPNQG